ncbi:glycosyltransferase [Fodinibius sediminis]|uniref:Glycosyltransferase involved in cell wall bisynthesis n=1 Tax=Fodinibius sediminis TaxID=1214077 RepID=A0A521D8K9_9BACT|nr:glycosyltransferase [Fodinibius sediminis]SMO68029.1 Glycosyltransferase involved in cell wall bisynthesis [Fodinibius sediminis]
MPEAMTYPLVSVITPVYNAEEQIDDFLDALQNQQYPREHFEIIVVDNGSTDRTVQKIQSHSDIILCRRTDVQNPYAARNEGLSRARGDILVLLDVNCTPTPHWLQNGIRRLRKTDADLVGGQISFTYSNEETFGEWYDSLLFVDMKDLIDRGQSCAGGNLFFKREVLDTVGPFPENHRSGMDLYWTKKASRAGFKLVYDAHAEVHYPARPFLPLMRKVFRVGTGQPKVWLDNDMHPVKLILLMLYQFVPPGTRELRDKIERRGKDEMRQHLPVLWGIHYLQKVVLSLGWAKGFAKYYLSKS